MMLKFSKILILLVGIHLLWGGAIFFRRVPIEQDLTARVEAGLNRPEFSDVAVVFNGRQGTLSGSVDSAESLAKAERFARRYWGVRAIENRLEVAAVRKGSADLPEAAVVTPGKVNQPARMADLRGYQLDGKFMLSGNVPDEDIRNRLINQAEEVFGPDNVAIALRMDHNLNMPADFMKNYRDFLDSHRLQAVGFEFDNGEFTLKADLPEEFAEYRSAEKISSGQMAVHNISYQNNAAANEPTDADRIFMKLELNKILSALVIEFDTSSAALTERTRQQIDQAVGILNRYPENKIEIQGHTDNAGLPEANRQLSSARALTVYDYLIKHGLAAKRLDVTGYGETRPLGNNRTAEGRQRNRRVVLLAP